MNIISNADNSFITVFKDWFKTERRKVHKDYVFGKLVCECYEPNTDVSKSERYTFTRIKKDTDAVFQIENDDFPELYKVRKIFSSKVTIKAVIYSIEDIDLAYAFWHFESEAKTNSESSKTSIQTSKSQTAPLFPPILK